MSALPVVSGRAVVQALGKVGYALDRQRGSHAHEPARPACWEAV